ncbi:MAG: hypothetical protein KAI45_08900 [Melioribacteraceae bacterium]|nr:hypothetical protein [Melioribacteraceae bacterium]
MFRILSIVAFIVSFVWIFKYFKKSEISFKEISNYYFTELKNSFSDLKSIKSKSLTENLHSLQSVVYLVTIFAFLIMVITGFISLLFTGGALTGILLMIHVSIAPFISITFAMLVILFAQSNRFNDNDITISTENDGKKKIIYKDSAYLKINFWLISIFSLPAMISIILSMFPLFGTEGQINLLEIHRYSVLIISILVIFHIGLLSVSSKQFLKISSNNT